MGSRFGIGDGYFGYSTRRLFSLEGGLIGVSWIWKRGENTTMTVGCVLAETDINGEHQLGEEFGQEV
jgi:hypothetical protein